MGNGQEVGWEVTKIIMKILFRVASYESNFMSSIGA